MILVIVQQSPLLGLKISGSIPGLLVGLFLANLFSLQRQKEQQKRATL